MSAWQSLAIGSACGLIVWSVVEAWIIVRYGEKP